MFRYFGGKWRAAPHYPKPLHDTIIEPFAGAAGYSLRYHERNVVLCDSDPTIANLWKYLIEASSEEILALPLDIEDLRHSNLSPEAKSLVGFWYNPGSTRPCNRRSSWTRNAPDTGWCEQVRARIASQVSHIRHWKIYNCSYHQLKETDTPCTWFVDPPYELRGKPYKHSQVDYSHLSKWVKSRIGQVIACENAGANWLPFQSFMTIAGASGKSRCGKKRPGVSHEVMYYHE